MPKTARIDLRLEEDFKADLQARADAAGVSLNTYILTPHLGTSVQTSVQVEKPSVQTPKTSVQTKSVSVQTSVQPKRELVAPKVESS